MLVVTEAEVTAIRTVFEQRGKLSAEVDPGNWTGS
jgi:hypothetical protein